MTTGLLERGGNAGINWGSLPPGERFTLALFSGMVGDSDPGHLSTEACLAAATEGFPALRSDHILRNGRLAPIGTLRRELLDVLYEAEGQSVRLFGRLAVIADVSAGLVAEGIGIDRDLGDNPDMDTQLHRICMFAGFVAGELIGIKPESV
jgi:hypothetical protein